LDFRFFLNIWDEDTLLKPEDLDQLGTVKLAEFSRGFTVTSSSVDFKEDLRPLGFHVCTTEDTAAAPNDVYELIAD
jgi:hypothetical protein